MEDKIHLTPEQDRRAAEICRKLFPMIKEGSWNLEAERLYQELGTIHPQLQEMIKLHRRCHELIKQMNSPLPEKA